MSHSCNFVPKLSTNHFQHSDFPKEYHWSWHAKFQEGQNAYYAPVGLRGEASTSHFLRNAIVLHLVTVKSLTKV